MRSTKFIGLFAGCGFVLSFVAGLFSHSSILSVLIKALIFAVVFAALAFAISAVFNRFLSDGTSGDYQGEYNAESVAGNAAASAPVTGRHVDITIQDEELKPSESENHFVVGDNHQMLNDSDMADSGNAFVPDNSKEFVPLRNFETLRNLSGKEAVPPSQVEAKTDTEAENAAQNMAAVSSSPVIKSTDEDGIDTLPDMDNFVFGESESSSSSDEGDDTISDSDFVSSSSPHKKNDVPAEVQDASLMAKAISSVLSDEESL